MTGGFTEGSGRNGYYVIRDFLHKVYGRIHAGEHMFISLNRDFNSVFCIAAGVGAGCVDL